jgi:glycosyltransferase involved in cell wall biosynthesis
VSKESIRITFLIPIATHLNIHPSFESWISAPALQDHEVILIVDESKGGGARSDTVEVIRRIETSSLPHVAITRTHAGNPGASRNQGLKATTGQWIFFWDADDFPDLNNAIALTYDAEVSGADIGIGSVNIIGDSESVIGNSWFDIYRWPGLWRFTFKSELIERMTFEEWGWCEDQKFLVQALEGSRSIYRGKHTVYTYTLNSPGSQTTIRENWESLRLFLAYLKEVELQQRRSLILILFHVKTLIGLRKYVSLRQSVTEFAYLGKVLIRNRPNFLPKLARVDESGSHQ